MKTALFYIPLPHGAELEEYHAFLDSHRIVSIQKEVLRRDTAPCLLCVVDYDEHAARPGQSGKSASRPDYKELLSAEEFVVYCRLRDWRKETAEAEGVPVFRIFSNEQLAEIARRKDAPVATLWKDFRGVGAGKIERYAEGVQHCLVDVPNEKPSGHPKP